LLKVEDLRTYFPVRRGILKRTVGYVRAVDGVSFAIEPGRTLGLVGESGCGKTTVARSVIRLVSPTSGRVIFDGSDVLGASRRQLRDIRNRMSMVFQDPFGSLNPRMTVADIITEPLKVRSGLGRRGRRDLAAGLLARVGLPAAGMNRYPHEFSGGQRQRIGIARALALDPRLVICDEPVSALDVSIQSQILNLLRDIQDQLRLTFLFIAHDLAVVEFFCDFIAVMYMGRIVESASSRELYGNPLHPYTRILLAAVPSIKGRGGRKPLGEVPPMAAVPPGCAFAPRCPVSGPECSARARLPLRRVGPGEHFVACRRA
jgi:oligopeptide/dipeptide ABC transporter ATP-binding protein